MIMPAAHTHRDGFESDAHPNRALDTAEGMEIEHKRPKDASQRSADEYCLSKSVIELITTKTTNLGLCPGDAAGTRLTTVPPIARRQERARNDVDIGGSITASSLKDA